MNSTKILCGTDFSIPARRTSDACAALAAKLGTPLVLAHVHQPLLFAGEGLAESVQDASRRMLASEAERLRERGATVEEAFLDAGPPEEVLLGAVESRGAGLIVLASQQKRGFAERLLLGSIAEYVAEHAAVPTLIVRDAEPFEEWVAGKRPLGVFVAENLSSSSDAPLLWAKSLGQAGSCAFTVAYTNWVSDEALRLGLREPSSFFEESPEVHAVLERDLRERTKRLLGEVPARTVVGPRWGRADASLIELAKQAEADLIVVGTRQRRGLARLFDESVSRGALRHAPMNVAIVPQKGVAATEAPLPRFDRVLVPTDFSELSNHAIPYAYALVSPGGMVCLAHVTARFGSEEKEIARQLRALIPAEAAARGIHSEVSITEDDRTAEGIGHLAARFGADAICIGSHGRSGVQKALLGSVAQAVVEGSRCPVLIARKP